MEGSIELKACSKRDLILVSVGRFKSLKERPPDSHGGSRKTKTEPGLGCEAIFVEHSWNAQQAQIS